MITRNRKFQIILVFIFFISASAISSGYSVWDDLEKPEVNQTLPIGTWDFFTEVIGSQLASSLSTYVDDQIALDPNSPLQNIYDQSGNLSQVTVTVEDINVYGYVWDFYGIGTATPSTTLGFVSLIDRVENTGTPIHPILTPYTTTPTYPEYSYFTSYDVKNLLTNNQYSLRLNYGVTMTTNTTITNMTDVSFYASRGLLSPDDPYAMTNRAFQVEISTDNANWIQIGTATPSTPSANEINFTQYNYSIPAQYLNQNLYLRIVFNGEAIKSGNSRAYSRMIIDELIITTN